MRRLIVINAVIFVAVTMATFKGLSEYHARAAEENPPVVKLTAHKFEFEPAELRLKKDQTVVLELTSTDVDHGFNIAELNLRADLLPGKITRVRVTPEKAGRFEFHCDTFCGLNHEEMGGTLIIE